MCIIGTSPASGTHGWMMRSLNPLRNDYLPADYRADIGGVPVEGWVHVQAEVDHQLDPVARPSG
jgi:predicted TIM-barrel fold metal-dependent hydrolase